MTELDLLGRDCEVLAVEPGPLPAHANFDVIGQLVEGGESRWTPQTQEALSMLRDEWQQTADDLAGVDASHVTDAAAWEDVLQLSTDRLAAYTRRTSALDSGDADDIAAAFSSGQLGAPGWDWAAVGLERRDCRSISS